MLTVRPRSILFDAIFCLTAFFASPVSYAADSIYDTATLKNRLSAWGSTVQGLFKEDLKPGLDKKGQQVLNSVTLETPLVGKYAHPLEVYTDERKSIILPIHTIKMVDDLAVATGWFEKHKCDVEAVGDYLGLLRFNRKLAKPPLDTLKIPPNATKDSFVDLTAQNLLKSAVSFVLLHELGHAVVGSPSEQMIVGQAQDEETNADAFALDAFSRLRMYPLGAIFYFKWVVRFEPIPASGLVYTQPVRSMTTHPVAVNRISYLAKRLRSDAASFAAGQKDPAAWQVRLTQASSEIETLANTLSYGPLLNKMEERSKKATPQSLAAACTKGQ